MNRRPQIDKFVCIEPVVFIGKRRAISHWLAVPSQDRGSLLPVRLHLVSTTPPAPHTKAANSMLLAAFLWGNQRSMRIGF